MMNYLNPNVQGRENVSGFIYKLQSEMIFKCYADLRGLLIKTYITDNS